MVICSDSKAVRPLEWAYPQAHMHLPGVVFMSCPHPEEQTWDVVVAAFLVPEPGSKGTQPLPVWMRMEG